MYFGVYFLFNIANESKSKIIWKLGPFESEFERNSKIIAQSQSHSIHKNRLLFTTFRNIDDSIIDDIYITFYRASFFRQKNSGDTKIDRNKSMSLWKMRHLSEIAGRYKSTFNTPGKW